VAGGQSTGLPEDPLSRGSGRFAVSRFRTGDLYDLVGTDLTSKPRLPENICAPDQGPQVPS